MNGIQGTQAMVAQITGILEAIDDDVYARPLDIFNGVSLGQHFRHILNFYECLIDGVDRKVIDYSARRRDPQVECESCYALDSFAQIAQTVEALEEHQPISVKADFSSDSLTIRPLMQSSVGRELLFAYDHAIHHLALIRIGLQVACPELAIDKSFGVAPATVKYRQKER